MQRLRRRTLVAALLLSLPLILGLPARPLWADKEEAKPEPEPFGRLTVDQVETRLGQPHVFVYDGNKASIYAEHHLPGAVRLYHTDIKAGVLPEDKDATLIFYCMNEH